MCNNSSNIIGCIIFLETLLVTRSGRFSALFIISRRRALISSIESSILESDFLKSFWLILDKSSSSYKSSLLFAVSSCADSEEEAGETFLILFNSFSRVGYQTSKALSNLSSVNLFSAHALLSVFISFLCHLSEELLIETVISVHQLQIV